METVKKEEGLPEVLKIDDITSGRIDPDLIYNEIERLKLEINILRHDMSSFVKALAAIPEGSDQQQYYKTIAVGLKVIQESIKDYCTQYNKLLPIINLSQIKLGHEVEVIPQHNVSRIDKNSNNSKTKNFEKK